MNTGGAARRGISPGDCGANGVGPGACGLYTAIGEVNLHAALQAAKTMQERGTFGAGILLRGCYPKRKNYFAFHVLFRNREVARELEPLFTEEKVGMRHYGEMEPLVEAEMYRKYDLPEMRRYFMIPPGQDVMLRRKHTDNEYEYVRRVVEEYNQTHMGQSRIFSSGKDVGNFLTALTLEDTIRAFNLYQYESAPLTAIMAHMRWPTKIVDTGVWWGAHPISFLNSAVVHNGDLSSAQSNRQGLEAASVERMVGTDSEAILLEVDDLVTRRGFSMREVEWVMCQKFPKELSALEQDERSAYLKKVGDPILSRYKMSGPSSFIAIVGDKVIAGRDRDGLRQLWMGRSDDGKTVIWGSEEKVIYQTAWMVEKRFRAINCEPGKLVAFELSGEGKITDLYGETLAPRNAEMPI